MNFRTRDKAQLPRIDFHKALCEGVAEAAVKNAAIGYPENFIKPGEHVTPPRVKPVVRVSMTAEEFLEAAKARTRP